jgi:hypothetical protein
MIFGSPQRLEGHPTGLDEIELDWYLFGAESAENQKLLGC